MTAVAEYPVYFQIGLGFSILEGISSSLIIIPCVLFPELRSSSHTCIMWIAISIFFQSLSFVAFGSPSENSWNCYVQSFMQQMFSISAFLSVVLFATDIGSLQFDFLTERQNFRVTLKSYIFVWGTALVLAILPLVTGSIGKNFGRERVDICWIMNQRGIDNLVIIICYYIPLAFSIIYTLFIFFHVRIKARSEYSRYFTIIRLYVLFTCS